MKDMKLDYSSQCMPCDPDYSGLKLYLADNQIKALEMSEMPEAGAEITIQAKAIVRRTKEECTEAGESYSMCVEIVEMGVSGKKMDMKKTAETLYGKEQDDE